MDVKAFAARCAGVASQQGVDGGVGVIAEWIAIILPVLLNLPCFKPKTAAEKRQWIEDHPNISRNRAINALRQQNPGTKRREAGAIADTMLEEAASLTDEQFASVCASAGA